MKFNFTFLSKKDKKLIYLDNNNKEVLVDYIVTKDILNEFTSFENKVFVRMYAKNMKFTNVSFQHCIFETCYINKCKFDSCNFTGCKFIGSNFHRSSFPGCDFRYATFERSQFDHDILDETPKEENLEMHFARSLRMNFQQLGDSKAVNKAITLELKATSVYLYNSWKRTDIYHKEKYTGIRIIVQFLKWVEFWLLDFIWGNGESILKLIRSIAIVLIAIAIYDTSCNHPDYLGISLSSLLNSPAIFLGIHINLTSGYTTGILSVIAALKYISFALFTTLLVKRFSRR